MVHSAEQEQQLFGRVATVTGAARGIGEAIAFRLARLGATVILADQDADPALEVAKRIVDEGLVAVGVSTDITDEASVTRLAAFVDQNWGRLDILVNNAAIMDATPLGELDRDRFRTVQEVNLNGGLWMVQALLHLLRRSDHGRIVNIASILGIRGSTDSISYASAKGGIVNMTRALAVDLAKDGILVNCICPGFVDTRMALLPDGHSHEHQTHWFQDIYVKYARIPLRRAADADEIAAATSFFCGDDCRYVTGQILLVDGGLSATF